MYLKQEKAEKGELCFGTVDTYDVGAFESKFSQTDYTNASRTMLFNIHTLEWDEELLNLFGIPRAMLPEVHPSGHLFGYASKRLSEHAYRFAGLPVTNRQLYSDNFVPKRND